MTLRDDYDERAISQATAFLDDPPGTRAVLDAIDQPADDPRPDRSFPYGSPDLRIGRPASGTTSARTPSQSGISPARAYRWHAGMPHDTGS